MSQVLSDRSKHRLEFSIHAAALPAFSFFHTRDFWIDKTELTTQSLRSINLGLPLQAITESNNKIAIISGFESLSFSLTTLNLHDCDVIIHDAMSDQNVEKRAWYAVIRTMISSLNTRSAEDFRRALNQQVPSSIIRTIFSKNQLSQTKLACLTHISRSSLAQQHAKSQEHQLPTKQEYSIFEELVMEQKIND